MRWTICRNSTVSTSNTIAKPCVTVGTEMDAPVTQSPKGVALDSALRLMLGDLDPVYLIRDDGLLIITQRKGPPLLRQGAIDPAAYLLSGP
jgi:hypothetical protein